MAITRKLSKRNSRALFGLVRSQLRPAGTAKGLNVEVVEVRRRVPWLLMLLVPAGAGAVGAYAWRMQQQEQEAQRLKAEAEAKAQALAKAKEAEAARAEELRVQREQEAAEAARKEREAEEAREAEEKRQAALAFLESACLECTQLLGRVASVEDAAEYFAAFDADKDELRELLADVQTFSQGDAFQVLQGSSEVEKSHLASQLQSKLSFLRLFLERLQRAEVAEEKFDKSAAVIKQERQRWLAGKSADLGSMQDALVQAEAALAELQETGLDPRAGEEVVEAGRSTLREEEEAARKLRQQEAARSDLEATMGNLDGPSCAAALQGARAAGCGPLAAAWVAEAATLEVSVQLPHDCPPQPTSQVDDFAKAAAAAAACMSESQLQEHVAHLAQTLVRHHVQERLELLSSWQALAPSREGHRKEQAAKAQAEFGESKEQNKQKEKEALKALAARHLQEAVEEAVKEVHEQSERSKYDLHCSAMLNLQEEQEGQIAAFESLVSHLHRFPERLSSQVTAASSPQHLVEAASASTVATFTMQDGFQRGMDADQARRLSKTSDGFVANVLGKFAAQLANARVCTTEELQGAFQRQLPDLMAAAFEPSSGFASALLGRVFGGLYRLKGEQREMSLQAALASKLGVDKLGLEESVEKQNLRALAEALALVEAGELRRALAALDTLAGRCRSRAEGWMKLARQTLLLQQASDAVLARTLCLSTGLSE